MAHPLAEYIYWCRSNDTLPWVGWYAVGPRNEHSKARLTGPTETYVPMSVAGSAPGASNAAR
jgi:hypothetical protein